MEHGRYANACRRTLGRTGALGEEGVRQRLQELIGRSLEPEEVVEEMQRDKGFGKWRGGLSADRENTPPKSHDNEEEKNVRRYQPRRIQLQHTSNKED